jgi:hypothetical protein
VASPVRGSKALLKSQAQARAEWFFVPEGWEHFAENHHAWESFHTGAG